MRLTALISASGDLAQLQQLVSREKNSCILAPNDKIERWLKKQDITANIVTHEQFIGDMAGAASHQQMMIFTILALQEIAPSSLSKASMYNNIIAEFYESNALTWPLLHCADANYINQHFRIIQAHTQKMIQAGLAPPEVIKLRKVQTGSFLFLHENPHINTIIFIKPTSLSLVEDALWKKLTQLSKMHEKPKFTLEHNNIPLYAEASHIDELLRIDALSAQHKGAIVVSADDKFQQLYQAYYGDKRSKALHDILRCIVNPTIPDLREALYNYQLNDDVLALILQGSTVLPSSLPSVVGDMIAIRDMLQKETPFLTILKAQLQLCMKMDLDVSDIMQAADGVYNSCFVSDYAAAWMALVNMDSECFSIKDACKTPAQYFIIQGANQDNWLPNKNHMNQIRSLIQRGRVIFTRAKHHRNIIYEQASFLIELPINEAVGQKKDITIAPCSRPNPRPPLSVRPINISISAVELLIRDPYAYYSRYILGLRKKEKQIILAREFGLLAHEVMMHLQLMTLPSLPEFSISYNNLCTEMIMKSSLPVDEKSIIKRRMDNLLTPLYRLLRSWRNGVNTTKIEIKSSKKIILSEGKEAFIQARSDRVDYMEDGSIRVIDYKTGVSPAQSEVNKGLYPQLPLEAIIHSDREASLFYIEISGKIGKFIHRQVQYDIEAIFSSITKLLEMFLSKEAYGYFALTVKDPKTKDYQHLARAEEWRYGT